MNNITFCSECLPEDHDGVFCRCESRNIEVAKKLREGGQSPWEKRQAPHQKLTDEEVKELICELNVELYEIKEHFLEQMELVESHLYRLKRHFCPEKFEEMKVPANFLEDMFKSSYGNMNLSEPMRFTKPEVSDGVPEAE